MRWEYKTIKVKAKFLTGGIDAEAFEVQLNALGREGWELVTVMRDKISLCGLMICEYVCCRYSSCRNSH